jgi:hypothetical protein
METILTMAIAVATATVKVLTTKQRKSVGKVQPTATPQRQVQQKVKTWKTAKESHLGAKASVATNAAKVAPTAAAGELKTGKKRKKPRTVSAGGNIPPQPLPLGSKQTTAAMSQPQLGAIQSCRVGGSGSVQRLLACFGGNHGANLGWGKRESQLLVVVGTGLPCF